MNVSHADLGGSPQRHNHSRPSCNQDDAGLNPIWSPEGKHIAALMPVDTAEAQKEQNQVIFLENFSDELQRKVPVMKSRHTPQMAELPRKQFIRNVLFG